MIHVNRFFFTSLAFNNISLIHVILILSALNNQKIIQFTNA